MRKKDNTFTAKFPRFKDDKYNKQYHSDVYNDIYKFFQHQFDFGSMSINEYLDAENGLGYIQIVFNEPMIESEKKNFLSKIDQDLIFSKDILPAGELLNSQKKDLEAKQQSFAESLLDAWHITPAPVGGFPVTTPFFIGFDTSGMKNVLDQAALSYLSTVY